jgi:hypothetical protein
MIAKKSLVFLVLVCLGYTIEYSVRIKALGTDFAYLIPDYETDLYQNPQLLGTQLAGISFEPDLNEPVTARILFKRFGVCGSCWGSYSDHQSSAYTTTNKHLYINDLWMLDLRGKVWKFLADDVWHWYNDGDYYEWHQVHDSLDYDSVRTIKYLFGVNDT